MCELFSLPLQTLLGTESLGHGHQGRNLGYRDLHMEVELRVLEFLEVEAWSL